MNRVKITYQCTKRNYIECLEMLYRKGYRFQGTPILKQNYKYYKHIQVWTDDLLTHDNGDYYKLNHNDKRYYVSKRIILLNIRKEKLKRILC